MRAAVVDRLRFHDDFRLEVVTAREDVVSATVCRRILRRRRRLRCGTVPRMSVRPRTILVGYSGSESGGRALAAAADLVGYGSRLTVVSFPAGERDGDLSNAARERLLGHQVTARLVVSADEPADALIETAIGMDADLIVVGSNGSLGPEVVRRAPCDVLVVR